MTIKYFYFLLGFLFLTQACTDDNNDDSSSNYEDLRYFYDNASSLKIDVAYEPGAEPYINQGFGGSNNFLFTKNNLDDLLAGRSNTISVETDILLSDMTQIPSQNKTGFTSQDILTISKNYQTNQSTANQGVVFVIYLDGYYNLNGQNQNNVLGLSVGSFVVAIFKPVVESVTGGGLLGGSPKYAVEQATVVHEVGHALGLVNNGVDLHTSHQDTDHGKHCTNTDCVMYWANEGSGNAAGLFGSSASVNQLVFGQECKDDVVNY